MTICVGDIVRMVDHSHYSIRLLDSDAGWRTERTLSEFVVIMSHSHIDEMINI